MRRKLIAGFCMISAAIVFLGHGNATNQCGFPMYNYYIKMSFLETNSVNSVTAIYLFYRYYDTLFESMMLLFSIIAVIYMSVHEGGDSYE